MTVPVIRLGDGLAVSRLGFGAMALTGVYGTSTHRENLTALNLALDVGVTLIDTADIYGDGVSERTVGEIARTRRDGMTIATKFGITGSIAEKTMPGSGLRPSTCTTCTAARSQCPSRRPSVRWPAL